jgi:hypothetical protein
MFYKIIDLLFIIAIEILLNEKYFYAFMAIYIALIMGLIYKLYKMEKYDD